jgi:hypothetical protein
MFVVPVGLQVSYFLLASGQISAKNGHMTLKITLYPLPFHLPKTFALSTKDTRPICELSDPVSTG